MPENIKAYQCQKCERYAVIAPAFCPDCREKNSFVPIEVEGRGEILTYTVVYVSEERFSAETPYPLAVIELNKNLRILGRINTADFSKLQIGMEVKLVKYSEQVPVFE